MDRFDTFPRQQAYFTTESLKLYFFAFLFVLFMLKIYFTPALVFLLICSQWWPQIWKNMIQGNTHCPSMKFVILQTAHVSYIPLYFMITENNLLFIRPNPVMFWVCVAWLVIQIGLLKV